MNEESQKHHFLKGVNNPHIEALDLMMEGDITKTNWKDIKRICLSYSRETLKKEIGVRSILRKSNGSGVSKAKLSILLYKLKNIINNVVIKWIP